MEVAMKKISVREILDLSKETMVVLIGPTAAGKDTLLNELRDMGATTPVSTTTRPMRVGEIDGREYYFLVESAFREKEFIEKRHIHTAHGIWSYGMSVEEGSKDGVTILDYDGYLAMSKWRESQGLSTTAVLVDIDKETAKMRYLNRGGDLAEFERRWEADDVWVEVVRTFGNFIYED